MQHAGPPTAGAADGDLSVLRQERFQIHEYRQLRPPADRKHFFFYKTWPGETGEHQMGFTFATILQCVYQRQRARLTDVGG